MKKIPGKKALFLLRLRTSSLTFVAVLLLLTITESASAQYTAGQSYYGRNNYIQYIAGDLPVIFSAPHGGNLEPAEIPDRTWGTLVTDSYTMETAFAIYDAVHAYTGRHPHVIISRLKRTKLDPNREIGEAAQQNQYAEQAYREFHAYIDSAKAEVEREYGKGLYLDLHGHGHSFDRLELGYMISSSRLELSDSEIEQYENISSIRALSERSSLSFAELLRGSESFGSMLIRKGIPAVPSSLYRDPDGYAYFSGGHNTKYHGSRYGGNIDGIQIEMHRPGIRDTDANRRAFAQDLTEVIDRFLETHYGFQNYVTGVEDPDDMYYPDNFRLSQNYPNPFNAETRIAFEVPKASHIQITVFTVTGKRAAVLLNNYINEGRHSVYWNAADLASGIYFIVLKSENVRLVTKALLLK